VTRTATDCALPPTWTERCGLEADIRNIYASYIHSARTAHGHRQHR
jgi:hypothetical protein